jgi:hypothetical protein
MCLIDEGHEFFSCIAGDGLHSNFNFSGFVFSETNKQVLYFLIREVGLMQTEKYRKIGVRHRKHILF